MYQSIAGSLSHVMPAALATGLFTSRCTIQTPAISGDGEPFVDPSGTHPGTYTPISGLIDIPCMDAPESTGEGITATEVKALDQTASIEVRHVLLGGYFAALDTQTDWGNVGWRAVVTNQYGVQTTLDILGAEPDSQRTQMRLKLRQVTV